MEKRRIDDRSEILKMKPEEVKKVLKHKLYGGTEKRKQGSRFFAYAGRAHTQQDVIEMYKQMRYRYADADHVICAYRLLDEDIANSQDSVDDGELGAGRKILNMLIENGQGNCAVYVVRYHDGPNLGKVRFDFIKQCADSAVKALPPTVSQMLMQQGTLMHNDYSHYRAEPTVNRRGRGGFNVSMKPSQWERTYTNAAKRLDFGSHNVEAIHSTTKMAEVTATKRLQTISV